MLQIRTLARDGGGVCHRNFSGPSLSWLFYYLVWYSVLASVLHKQSQYIRGHQPMVTLIQLILPHQRNS